MINLISIFTRGGAVLWSKEISTLKGNPINDLIQNVILEDRGGEHTMEHGSFTLKWTFANQLELVFVAVYLNLARLLYVDELLLRIKEEFMSLFKGQLVPGQPLLSHQLYSFDSNFEEILKEFETKHSRKKAKPSKPRGFYETEKGKEHQRNTDKKPKEQDTPQKDGQSDDSGSAEEDNPTEPVEFIMPTRIKKKGPGGYRGKKGRRVGRSGRSGKPIKVEPKNGKKPKKPTTWGKKVLTKAEEDGLNYSLPKSGDDASEPGVGAPELGAGGDAAEPGANPDDSVGDANRAHMYLRETTGSDPNLSSSGESSYGSSDESSEDDEDDDEVKEQSTGLFGYFSALKNKVDFNRPLTEEDLESAIDQIHDDLVKKNVASEICDKLCSSVKASLVGKKLGTFARVKPAVKKTLEEALLRIITPKKQVDVLHGVASAREKGRPYSVVFVGVNGVGKSTSLAKVAHYLTARNLRVSIAACDTFRSGAVEQLQTHATALKVRLYERGYAKDPCSVAMDAIKKANEFHDDVVLIDTAGRMQDNEPLMRALSKLVVQNKPDLILFVGEALVGNDAVDQLTKFNRALIDLSAERVPRLIDGIVLTKFDTVDDKVGAAISMTYTTGAPIVFIGTGQTYQDLKRVHAKTIIRMLLR